MGSVAWYRMLDIKLIREDPETVRANLARRHDPEKLELLDHVIAADKEWRELTARVNELRRRRNEISSEIGRVIKSGGMPHPSRLRQAVFHPSSKS